MALKIIFYLGLLIAHILQILLVKYLSEISIQNNLGEFGHFSKAPFLCNVPSLIKY